MRLEQALAAAGFPAGMPVSLAAIDRHGIVGTAVSGHWPSGRAVTHGDLFYTASLAKQVTGLAVAILVRDWHFDPDAPIANALAGLPTWGTKVTARQLLHHLSGLPPGGVLEASIPGHWTTTAVLDALRTLAHVVPGAYAYSNAGYVLLAQLVESVSRTPFPLFVAEVTGLAVPQDGAAQPQAVLMGDKLPLTFGDGGLWCSPARFVSLLDRQNHDAFGIESLVCAPAAAGGHYGWGVGIGVRDGIPVYSHAGSWPGAAAKSIRCPALEIAIVACAAGNESDRIQALVEAVFSDLR